MKIKIVNFQFDKGWVEWRSGSDKICDSEGAYKDKPYKWTVHAHYEGRYFEYYWHTFASPSIVKAQRYLKKAKESEPVPDRLP